jgi:hypothetical protein
MAVVKEFTATDPWDYKASAGTVQVLGLPDRRFAWIEGQGDPNGPVFAQAMGALYSLTYTARMSYKAKDPPKGAGPYKVGLLQGRWDLRAGEKGYSTSNKGGLAWVVMIRQPDFLDDALFKRFVSQARDKAARKGEVDPAWFDRLTLGFRDAGRYAQIMHVGPYDAEPATFELLERQLAEQCIERVGKWHWEIYHGDPRRSKPENLRTILRVQVRG